MPIRELVDKTTEVNFKTIVNYVRNQGLLLAWLFLFLPFIRDNSDPSSQYLVKPRNPRAQKPETRWDQKLASKATMQYSEPSKAKMVLSKTKTSESTRSHKMSDENNK